VTYTGEMKKVHKILVAKYQGLGGLGVDGKIILQMDLNKNRV
jgi:hypothetical protein